MTETKLVGQTMNNDATDRPIPPLAYRHVDVFTQRPLSGNGLTVFFAADGLPDALLLGITQEMRQFESIFLGAPDGAGRVAARIFTMEEELAFAGHPVLGAACALHERHAPDAPTATWTFRLAAGDIPVTTARTGAGYSATMEQPAPTFGAVLAGEALTPVLAALSLRADDRAPGLPAMVVSTGLPYLIVPLRAGLDRARIVGPGFADLLAGAGAQFVYVLDVGAREGRTWDNDGRVEDVATGSAAGPSAAYLVRHGLALPEEDIVLAQGRFVGRPSRIVARVRGTAERMTAVAVSGDVRMVAAGHLTP